MNGYLLDTNVALIASVRSATLSAEIREVLVRGPLYLSVLVYWEVMLKSMKGKLDVGVPRVWWSDAIDQAAQAIPLRAEHIAEVQRLPSIHSDPFDRALIAQAIVEDLALLTTDATIGRYASQAFRVIR